MRRPRSGDSAFTWETARGTLVASLVVIALLVTMLALWKLRLLLALLFLAFVIAAAMRPTVEGLAARRVPRAAAILANYAVFAVGFTLLLWAVVPRAKTQIEKALWLLPGIFAGLVEVVPVIGPLAAGALAVGVGLSVDVEHGVLAGAAVLVVRLLEDYLVIPRVLGEAVGLSPLLVLVSVAATGLLFGGFAVPLAIPLAAVVATLFDVIVLNKEPSEEEVPTVLLPAKDAETT